MSQGDPTNTPANVDFATPEIERPQGYMRSEAEEALIFLRRLGALLWHKLLLKRALGALSLNYFCWLQLRVQFLRRRRKSAGGVCGRPVQNSTIGTHTYS